jgi:hypothetical protein
MLLRRCLWLVCAFVTSAVSAAPTELRIAVDQDNSLSTGCRVITNLGNVDGIDAILTTTDLLHGRRQRHHRERRRRRFQFHPGDRQTNGTVTLVATPGVSITGNGTASVTAQGPMAALNAAMNGMQYTPTSNYFGAAQLTITSNDLGNSGAGGPQSATSNVAITVTPVNDAPSFTPGGDANSFEDTPYSAAWAGAVSAGPNESAQTPAFVVTSNDNLALFASGPAISAAGLLTYTPAANASGSASITVVLGDNGGTAGGGVDTSGPQTFNIRHAHRRRRLHLRQRRWSGQRPARTKARSSRPRSRTPTAPRRR